jgi:hypothetical protein
MRIEPSAFGTSALGRVIGSPETTSKVPAVGASVATTAKTSALVVGSDGTTSKVSAEAVPAVRRGVSARVSAAVASVRLMPPPVG